MLWRVAQAPRQVGATGDAFELRRLAVEPAHQGFVVVLAVQHYHAPEQGVEGRWRDEHRLRADAFPVQHFRYPLLGHEFAAQAGEQIEAGERQGRHRQAQLAPLQAEQQAAEHRRQQRQGIERVDDENARPDDGRRRQRPEQLGAIAGEAIQQGVGGQHQPEAEEQPPRGVVRIRPPAPDQPGEQYGQAAEDKDRMAEAAVVGHGGHRVGIADHHVQVRQGAEHGAIQKGLAALPAAEHRALDGGAEQCLGQ
ncbi:hypothetical protein FQZ97_883750 [compost metagenome]